MVAVEVEEDLKIARAAVEVALVVKFATVWVMPAVSKRPLGKLALFTAIVLKTFAPLTVILSPEKVMLL